MQIELETCEFLNIGAIITLLSLNMLKYILLNCYPRISLVFLKQFFFLQKLVESKIRLKISSTLSYKRFVKLSVAGSLRTNY